MYLPGEQVTVICDGIQQVATVTSYSEDSGMYTVQLDDTGELVDIHYRQVAAKV